MYNPLPEFLRSTEFLLFLVIVGGPMVGLVTLDIYYHNAKNHPTTEKEVPTRKEKEDKKYPPGERDTKMRNAIKAHRVSQIRSLLEGHDFTMAKSKQNKADQRFTKGLYGGWDWELCKQLSPRFAITLFWSLLFDPLYFLSNSSGVQFLKIPLSSVRYGFTAFLYAMQFIGFATKEHRLADKRLKEWISTYWAYWAWANILYMLYRLYTDIKAPSYLMMILASDQFTPKEKKSLQALFYTKMSAGKNPHYKPRAMQTYGVICTQHKEAENIEDLLTTNLEARIKHIDEEDKPRGHAWIMSVWLPRLMFRALRASIFYSGLTFTYIALPASSDGTYKMATYTDGVALGQDEYIKDGPNGEVVDTPKLMWKIVPLMWAICLHSGLSSEYQLPEVQDQAN